MEKCCSDPDWRLKIYRADAHHLIGHVSTGFTVGDSGWYRTILSLFNQFPQIFHNIYFH